MTPEARAADEIGVGAGVAEGVHAAQAAPRKGAARTIHACAARSAVVAADATVVGVVEGMGAHAVAAAKPQRSILR